MRAKWSGLELGPSRANRGQEEDSSCLLAHRFYQQVCSHLHMFFLMGDYQTHKQLPSTLYLRLLQLATASIDYYEPWDQASLVRVAQHHLEGAQSLLLDDGEPFSCPYQSFQPGSS